MSRFLNQAKVAVPSRWVSFALLSALLGVSACAKKAKPETTKAEPAAAVPSLSPAEKRAEEQKVVEELAANLKTQEDFEEAAETEITEKTVDSELEKLGVEITQDPDVAASAAPAAAAASK
jgi:hypothetical protein